MEDGGKPESKYSLRDNPKKSRKFEEIWPDKKRNEVNLEEKDDFWSRESYGEEAAEKPCQSDNEVCTISMRARKQRRIDSSKEYGKEEENAALCLLMLKTGTHSVSDLCDKMPSMIGFVNKDHSFCYGDEEQHYEKPKVSSLSSIDESGMDSSCKRSRYECTICNKGFHSYQALGGHSASHKKINQNCQIVEKLPEKLRCHKCSICGKKFPSGQALGGHKRSHLVAANKSASAVVNSIDLNLPAPDNEC